MSYDDTMTCDCCGGDLPIREVWEACRDDGSECTGSVDANGRCQAFGDDAWLLNDMASVLLFHGPMFSGSSRVAGTAQEWLDYDFAPSETWEWCEIGVWDAMTAAEFRDAGLTPREVKAASERLIEAEQAAWDEEPTDEENPIYKTTPKDSQYTEGDPIYAVCNGDLKASVVIEAAK